MSSADPFPATAPLALPESEPGRAPEASPGAAVLACERLARVYPGPPPVTALADATFTAAPGRMTALVGRSGSGKTTLLTLIGLLDAPTSGRLVIAGTDASALSSTQRDELRRASLGFVFQSFHLVRELSARENVALALRYQGVPRSRHRAACGTALERVGLSHRVDARVSTLSGGEQQRVALARALVKEPALLLADEPTGNLDSANEVAVIDLLRQATSAGTTVVVVTHSPIVAAAADRALTVHDGVVRDEPAASRGSGAT